MLKAPPTKPWHVVRSSSIHSRGVFAKRDIPKDTEILEYLGEKISKAESERRAQARMARHRKSGVAAVYIFALNNRQDLDGSSPKNTARLLNHSCDPNCEALQERGRIWVCAKRDIKEGEELTFNYGFDLENWDEHECRCGTKRCVGFIVGEEYWPGLKKKMQERLAEVRASRKKDAAAAKKLAAQYMKDTPPWQTKKKSAVKKKAAAKKKRAAK
ncbi:MAG: protein-lysine N-methyltransferase [Verrucomicrobiaceae bacterium]|nr:protein-lysine N-methyltransferase [Verrucomicrobiaceae bacterium]